MMSRLIVRLFVCLLFCGLVICLLAIAHDRTRSFTKEKTVRMPYLPRNKDLPRTSLEAVDIKAEDSNMWATDQDTRRSHVRSYCQEAGRKNVSSPAQINPTSYSRMYVDDTYGIIFCEIPKVARTNWKRILLILTGKLNTSDPEQIPQKLVHTIYQRKYLRTLKSYSPEEIYDRLQTYYKFMIVRNPFERLVSAFNDKFAKTPNNYYHTQFGRGIIKRFRENATEHSLKFGDDVSFGEFVQYLIQSKTARYDDIQWMPYDNLCHPCMVQYDFIGTYETFQDDAASILDDLSLTGHVHFPERPNMSRGKTVDKLKYMFSNITLTQINELWKLYSVDFKMFSYPYPDLS